MEKFNKWIKKNINLYDAEKEFKEELLENMILSKGKFNKIPKWLINNNVGVYLIVDKIKNEILYIGKAKLLRNRILSHFSGCWNLYHQIGENILKKYDPFEIGVIAIETKDSFYLETELIKEIKPEYNTINLLTN